MLDVLVCGLFLISNSSIFIVDSTIYRLDDSRTYLYSRPINAPVDYVLDDKLYMITRRQLLTISQHDLKLIDHLPLPYQFNYALITPVHIGLVTSNEIVLIERKNLSYTGSIGLETGDNKPLIKNYPCMGLDGNTLFMQRDSEEKSILFLIDAQSGGLRRKITTSRIIASHYMRSDECFYLFDRNKQVQVFDQDLKKKRSKKTGITADQVKSDAGDFIVTNREYISRLNNEGDLIDYQPCPQVSRTDINIMALISNKRIVLIDCFTVRPMNVSSDARWAEIININDPGFFVAVDTLKMLYLVSMPALETRLLPVGKPVTQIVETPPEIEPAFLWYIQIGAFSSRDNAERTRQDYQRKNLPALIEETDMFRVKIGGFTNKETAGQFMEALGTNGWLVLQPKIQSQEISFFSLNSDNFRFKDGIISKERP